MGRLIDQEDPVHTLPGIRDVVPDLRVVNGAFLKFYSRGELMARGDYEDLTKVTSRTAAMYVVSDLLGAYQDAHGVRPSYEDLVEALLRHDYDSPVRAGEGD